MKLVPEEKGGFFSDTSLVVKLVFLGVVALALFLIIRLFLSKRTNTTQTHNTKNSHGPSTTQLRTLSLSQSLSNIHVCIHAFRCDPLPVAQTIFGAFEAAQFPQFVQIHIYQELNSQDMGVDAFELYRKAYLPKHTFDQDLTSNIHVKNANASDSAGPMAGFLILAKELVLSSSYTPMDQCIFVRPFYETHGTSCLYGVTFVQEYDQVLRHADLAGNVFSTKLCRTSKSSDDLLHKIAIESKQQQSIGGLLLANVAIPLMKNKMHSLTLVHDNVCTMESWKHMVDKQAGFTAWTSVDRCMAAPSIFNRTKKTAKVPVPFTTFRTYAHTREVRDVQGTLEEHANLHMEIVPMSGVCEDIQLMNVQTLEALVQKALSNPIFVKAIPYHAWTLMLSNLVGPNIYSCNHLALAVIADHVRTNRHGTQTLKHTMQFRPLHWKRVPRVRKQTKRQAKRNQPPIIDLVATNDWTRILPLHEEFTQYALVASDNVTMDAFLGICAHDTDHTLRFKYGDPANLARRRRMLGSL